MWPFKGFLAVHVATGAVGLVLFWVPVIGKKGASAHRRFGFLFARLMAVTATMAIGMATCTLLDPVGTHPHLTSWAPRRIQGIFGWMMLYLAVLTLHLVWHGLVTVRHKRDHLANRHPGNLALNALVIGMAVLCAWQGWRITEPLMMGISVVGVASGLTNFWFIARPAPARLAYQLEHVKAIVGSGISVYTAFMAFGFVRLMPDHALNPTMWAIPLVIGLAIIIYHQGRIRWQQRKLAAPAGAPSTGTSPLPSRG
ncbi:MAG: hypothetical protein KJT01_16655 [Gemmatimonadetes bacterium]|nr:hypothetical protein [Gemmatimonadota bacterium]